MTSDKAKEIIEVWLAEDWDDNDRGPRHEQGARKLLKRLAAAGLTIEEDWRPIEDAPKDGTRIMLAKIVGHPAHPTALWWVTLGHWSAKWNNWNDGIEPAGLAGPTHFRPLPPAPTEAKG